MSKTFRQEKGKEITRIEGCGFSVVVHKKTDPHILDMFLTSAQKIRNEHDSLEKN